MDLDDPAGCSTGTEEDHQHPPPFGESQTMPPLLVASPSPPTVPCDPLSWTTLHSSPIHSPPHQWHHVMPVPMTELLGYDGQQMVSSASLVFRSSPQALSPMLLDALWSFDDQQISAMEMGSGLDTVEANPIIAAAQPAQVPAQGTSSVVPINIVGENPGSPSVRGDQINHKWNFDLTFDTESLDTSHVFKERLSQALRYFKESIDQHLLIQVWAPVKDEDRNVLTTSGQPFVLDQQSSGLVHFRAVSTKYMFAIDGDNCGELGLPGRVYCQKIPEWTPNVEYYSSDEYPQIAHAQFFNVKGVLALPVFDPSAQSCISVVELIWTSKKINYDAEADKMCKALEAVNLKGTNIFDRPSIQIFNESRESVLLEILEVLTVICEEHKLPLAQTWVHCNHQIDWGMKSSKKGSCILASDVAFHVIDPHLWGFRDACVEHHLQLGQGVPGKALRSRTPCFSKDVRLFTKMEYPLAHYARMFGLAGSVALCVQSCRTGNDDYVLEFFLPPDCVDDADQKALLRSILTCTQGFCRLRVVGDPDLSKIYSQSLLHTDENGKLNKTFAESEGFHITSSSKNNRHDGLGVHQKLNKRKEGVSVKQYSRDVSVSLLHFSMEPFPESGTPGPGAVCKLRHDVLVSASANNTHHLSGNVSNVSLMNLSAQFEASREPRGPSCSQPLQIIGTSENPNYPLSMNNENGVGSDLIAQSNSKDVEVEPGDVPTKRRKLKSKAWLHFAMVNDSGFVKAKCKHCGKLYKADPKVDGTSRLLKHLKVHPMELSANQGASTHNQSKYLLSECQEIVEDNVPNEVIVLDSHCSGNAVGMISGIEEQLLFKINSAPEQEVLVQIEDVVLQKKVMESLANPKLEDGPHKYLQDDIIDACIHILKDKHKEDVRAHGRVFIETTFVCQLLHKASCSIYPIRGQEIKQHKKYGIEYLKHDMIFLPINQNCNHWYLAVINSKKQEIHVLDSLGKQPQEREELKYTLKQIEQCLELASSEVQSSNWPDYEVTIWNVNQENQIPKQTDMSSCGLFMIKYMEYWTGEKLSKEFTQADIDLFRLKLACELMSTPLNKAGK